MEAVEWLKEQITFDADGEIWTNFIDCYDLTEFFNKAKELEQENKDNFAIGFAEWINNNYWLLSSDDLWYYKSDGNNNDGIDTTELLQIYKSQL